MKIKFFFLSFLIFFNSLKINCGNNTTINSDNFFATPDKIFDFEPTMDEGWDTNELSKNQSTNTLPVSQSKQSTNSKSFAHKASTTYDQLKQEPWDQNILPTSQSSKKPTTIENQAATSKNTTYDQIHFQKRSTLCINVCGGQTEFKPGMNNFSDACLKCLCNCEDKYDLSECPFDCLTYFS